MFFKNVCVHKSPVKIHHCLAVVNSWGFVKNDVCFSFSLTGLFFCKLTVLNSIQRNRQFLDWQIRIFFSLNDVSVTQLTVSKRFEGNQK